MVLLEDFDEVFLISYDFNTLNNFFWITPPTNWNFSWLISLCAASESALSSQGSWWQTSNKQALYYCGHIQLEKFFVKKRTQCTSKCKLFFSISPPEKRKVSLKVYAWAVNNVIFLLFFLLELVNKS